MPITRYVWDGIEDEVLIEIDGAVEPKRLKRERKKAAEFRGVADWLGCRVMARLNDIKMTSIEGTACGIHDGCLCMVDCSHSEIGDVAMAIPLTSILCINYVSDEKECPPNDDMGD